MQVKIFTSRHDYEAQEQINDFINDKDVLDIKVVATTNEYGEPIYQYMIMYKETQDTTEIKVGDKVKVIKRDLASYGSVGYVGYIDDRSPVPYHVVRHRPLIGVPPRGMDYRQYDIYKLEDLELYIDKDDRE